MSEHYTHFSQVLTGITPEEATWIKRIALLARYTKDDEAELLALGGPASDEEKIVIAKMLDDGEGEAEVSVEDYLDEEACVSGVRFHSDNLDLDPHATGLVVQAFFRKFRHNQHNRFTLTWAETCNEGELGDYSGGAMLVTETKIWIATAQSLITMFVKEADAELF